MNNGSGNRQSESRTVAAFHAVRLHGSSEVRCETGQPQSVVVEIDDNLLTLIETIVASGVLDISARERYNSAQGLKVTIAVPSLSLVRIVGSAKLDLVSLNESDFQLAIEGEGEISAQGQVANFELEIEGSGTCRCFDLATQNSSVSISGEGEAYLSVSTSLSVEISGSGRIEYKGDPPRVTQDISGTGTVVKI